MIDPKGHAQATEVMYSDNKIYGFQYFYSASYTRIYVFIPFVLFSVMLFQLLTTIMR